MLLRLLRTHLRPYTGLLVCVLVLQFAEVMASLYLPTLNADISDKGVATGDSGYIWRMGAFMLGVSLAQGVCTVLATYLAARAAMSMGRDLRGFTAWTAHRGYHVYAMPTFNRKVRIMMDWLAAVVFRRDLASFGSIAEPGAAFATAARHDADLAARRKAAESGA